MTSQYMSLHREQWWIFCSSRLNSAASISFCLSHSISVCGLSVESFIFFDDLSESYTSFAFDFVTELRLWHLYVSSPHCHHSVVMQHLMIYFLSVLVYFHPHLLMLKERKQVFNFMINIKVCLLYLQTQIKFESTRELYYTRPLQW